MFHSELFCIAGTVNVRLEPIVTLGTTGIREVVIPVSSVITEILELETETETIAVILLVMLETHEVDDQLSLRIKTLEAVSTLSPL